MVFPHDPLDLRVELLLAGVWTDVTPWVSDTDRVVVTHGIADEAESADPATCRLTLENRDGRFSPKNPLSPYYGQLTRNTPLRVTVDAGVRFVGEVASWPPRWDLAGKDVWAPIEAAGVLRRLQQGASPVDSTLFQAITTITPDLVAYWPCEDGETSESISGGLPGVAAMQVIGAPDFAANSAMASSHPIPVLADSQWTGNIPAYTPTATNQLQVRWIQATPGSTSTGSGQSIMKVITSGSAAIWHLSYRAGGAVRMEAFNVNNDLLYTSGDIGFDINGTNKIFIFRLEQNGANVTWEIEQRSPENVQLAFEHVVVGQTVGRGKQVVVNNGGGVEDIAIGHITVQNRSDLLGGYELADALNAHRGETAGARLQRLCAAYDIPLRIEGDVADTARMGYQWPLELVPLLQECAATDGGILCDDRETLGLFYRTRASMYNQSPTLTVDYDAGDLAGSLEPTDDDAHTRNDVTVTRYRGGSARAELTAGPLSTAAPPAGAGRYRSDVTLSLYQGSDTPDQATWHLRAGTVDETRFPAISVNLRDLAADAIPSGTALNLNPDAETDTSGWLPFGGALAHSTAFAHAGSGSGQFTPDGVSASGGVVDLSAPNGSAAPGDERQVTAWVYLPTGHSQVRARLQWLDSVGGFLSSVNGATTDVPAGVWTLLHVTGTAPALTARCAPVVDLLGTPPASAVTYVDELVATAEVNDSIGLGLVAAAVGVDAGHRLAITSPPPWLPPEDIVQVVTGYTETLGNWERTLEFACTPASPLDVAEVDSGRYSSAGSTLAAGVTSSATVLSVATGSGPLWTTAAGDMPLDVMIGGERMTVTAISGTSSPQTFTVARSVNGIVKAQSSGATVQLFAPSYRGL